MRKTKTSQLRVPDDLIYDILIRLPAKSLQRFKVVSKPWRFLISDPNFAESHLHQANTMISQGKGDANLLRFGHIKWQSDRLRRTCLSLYSMDSNGSNRGVATLDIGTDIYSEIKILGSCNGLLLVWVDRPECYLWNPSIGEYTRINSNFYLNADATNISGLGYESTCRNYKGIIISRHVVSGPPSPHTGSYLYEDIHIYIYDYKSNWWRSKNYSYDGFPYQLDYDELAVIVNGVPHWRVSRDGEYDRFNVTNVVIYFELKTEKFKEVELPMWAVTKEIKFKLGVLGGCLCMSLLEGSSFGVWAMKEYGIPQSWTKLFVVSSTSFQELTPMCLVGKNQVLMEVMEKEEDGVIWRDRQKWIVFNLEEETQKILSLHRYRGVNESCTYVESLVFPERKY